MADTTLLDKVLDLKEKYGELQRQLSDPEVISDMKRYVQLNKEYKELDPIMKAGMEYKKMMDDYESAKEILATEKDEELREMAKEEIAGIRIYHSLPDRVEPEIPEETRYEVGFFLPFELFEKIQHAPIPVSGTVWRGNVYKCGDQTSHPHWASWRPVRRVNFHEPDCFDILEFE